ncbi:MAG: hypothetical protein WC848_04830 [Parcubacteria group bacterium]|jgi:hypothetical protein
MKKRSVVIIAMVAFFLTLVVLSGSGIASSDSRLETMKDSVKGIKVLLMAADFEPQDLSWMMQTGQDPDWDYLAKASFTIPVVNREYDTTLSGIPAGSYKVALFAFGESEWDVIFYSPPVTVSVIGGRSVGISVEMLPVGGHYIINLGSGLNEAEISARVSFIFDGEEINRQLYFWADTNGELKAEVFIPHSGTGVSLGLSLGKKYTEIALNWDDAVNGVISITPSFFEGGDLNIDIIWPSE